MGNLCCGEDDFVTGKKETLSGAPPPRKVMTPDEDQRREQARAAAEERLRKDSVRGTQRYHPKPKPKPVENLEQNDQGGPDISDWT